MFICLVKKSNNVHHSCCHLHNQDCFPNWKGPQKNNFFHPAKHIFRRFWSFGQVVHLRYHLFPSFFSVPSFIRCVFNFQTLELCPSFCFNHSSHRQKDWCLCIFPCLLIYESRDLLLLSMSDLPWPIILLLCCYSMSSWTRSPIHWCLRTETLIQFFVECFLHIKQAGHLSFLMTAFSLLQENHGFHKKKSGLVYRKTLAVIS